MNEATKPLAPLVGRASELGLVSHRLAISRLVTIVGPPGAGKTRLALEAALRWLAIPSAAAGFVDLAPLAPASDVDVVADATAAPLGIGVEPGRAVLDTLAIAVGHQSLLLVVDNCEHVLEGTGIVVEAMLERCPGLRVLATSRTPLGLVGETTLTLGPLEVPDDNEPPPGQVAASVRLFWVRALRADPSFELTTANYPPVAAICRHLGGLPLAIELAAARVSALTPTELALRIDPGMLVSTSRGAGARHQTLDAAIAWSHDLLSPAEKLLFRRLPVFSGGFTLAAAERICSGQGLGRDAVAASLQSLVDQSLVERSAGQMGCRYSLIGPLKAFACERWNEALHESGEVMNRHPWWCTELAEEAECEFDGPGRRASLHRLDAEYSNLWCGLAAAVDSRQVEVALRLAGAMAAYFAARGRCAKGRQWLEIAENADGGASPHRVRAKARWAFGYLSFHLLDLDAARAALRDSAALASACGDVGLQARSLLTLGSCRLLDEGPPGRAVDFFEQSRRLAGQAGDSWCHTMALAGLAWAKMAEGDLGEARSLLEEAAMAARADDQEAALAEVLPQLGLVALRQGELARADDAGREALVCGEELELPQVTARALAVLGELAWRSGDLAAARHQAGRAVELCRRSGLRGDLVNHLCLLGDVALADGDLGSARQCYTEAVAILGQVHGTCSHGVVGLGRVAVDEGDPWAAEVLFERALAGARRSGNTRLVVETLGDLGDVARALGRPEQAAARYGEALRCALEVGDAHAVANGLRAVAGLAADAGRPHEAARLFGAASTLGPGAEALPRLDVDPIRINDLATVQRACSAEDFSEAWSEGGGMTTNEAVALALAEIDAACRPDRSWELLSEKQQRIAALAAQGLTNGEIGERLYVTEATVKSHLWRAFFKLGITSRRDLTRLVPPPGRSGGGTGSEPG